MKKVLIIEDDPIVAHIYRTRLEKEQYTVEVCADGQTGFFRIHELRPDAVLLDLMLPKMKGVDVLKKIRAQSQFQKIPIIVFTNAYVPNMIEEAFAAGASQVFNKATLTPRHIIDALQVLLFPNTPKANDPLSNASPTFAPPAPIETPFQDPLAVHNIRDQPSSGEPTPRPAESEPAVTARPAVIPVPAVQALRISSDDSAFQADLFQCFVNSKPETLATLRRLLQQLTKAADEKARMEPLLELYRKVHALTGSAGIAGFNNTAQMTAALEVLLKELYDKPKNITASTVRTVAHSIDFIGEMFKSSETNTGELSEASILVVDDEILSRRAVSYALEKANLKSVDVEDSAEALRLATEKTFDLIFLDVQMPGMNGFELCTKIRGLSTNKATPIIFVTSLTDFKSRAKSSLSGGTDLIAKPFMFIELTVKALTHILKGYLTQQKQAA
jgi:CheY-like chemotaxis protein